MLKIRNLVKTYDRKNALDGLSMHVHEGELYGFVGPNGAGKTTTMKIIATLLKADSGQVIVDGIDGLTYPKQVKEKIGYMPDFFGVYDNLTTREYMEFYASAYRLYGKEIDRRIDELLELVDLKDKKEDDVDDLSRGMKQRLCLARTLIHRPKLLILDEPASGMEPRARLEMQRILRELSRQKVTILLSSHILQELSEVCTHIGIIESGKMRIQGSVKEIMAKQKSENPLVIKVLDQTELAVKILKQNKQISNIAMSEGILSVNFTGEETEEAELLGELIANGVRISSFRRDEGNLEDIFLKVTQ